jgi:uncharacterized membrane protein YphA (DoxX/SURF4 family)
MMAERRYRYGTMGEKELSGSIHRTVLSMAKLISQKYTSDDYAKLLLRAGLAGVFLYFGIQQLMHPEPFIGWLPSSAELVPLSGRTLVVLNGGFETFFGLLLLLGIFRRTSAFLLGAHLFGIGLTIGFTDIGIRDFGLALATLSLSLIKTDSLGFDGFMFDQFVKRIADRIAPSTST